MSDFPQSESPTVPSTPGRVACRAMADLAEQNKDGRYERGREIGRGGMGKILEVVDQPLRRSVALKVLIRPGDGENRNRFIREARITGALEHPSIVPVHELNVDRKGELFYTMKRVRGVTLLEILQGLARRDPYTLRIYPLSALLTIFQKVCDAVAFAHSQPEPVIHRDLKPENIMVGDYGEVLVMDWGAAKVLHSQAAKHRDGTDSANSMDHSESCESSAEIFVTQAGSVMGTPGYMAPEQARGQTASTDERTDIYALGGILYALLTWEAPIRLTGEQAEAFEQKSQNGERVTHVFHQHVAPLLSDRSARQRLGHPMPDSLVAVVLKAMSFRPEDRFQSVKELQADVAAYQAGRATTAERAGAWKHFKLLIARNKVLFSSIASIFVILLGATGISLYERQAALKTNQTLQLTLHNASEADLEAARQRFRAGAWREAVALLGRSLTFWPENREAANYLLSAIAFGQGDRDRLPGFGIYHNAAIQEAAFSPDGRYFATASHDHTTKVWDSRTGKQIGKTFVHTAPCNWACFSPDSRRIVTTDEDGVGKLWELQAGDLLATMRHGRPDLDSLKHVTSCVFSSDGKQILTASFDHTARIWDTDTGKEIAQLVNPQRVAYAVWSPDGTRLLTSYWYGGALLWDAKTFELVGRPMEHAATVRTAFFTPDGNRIATSSLDKTARIWDGHSGNPVSPPLKHGDFVWSLDVSPNGKLVATACYDKAVRLWSLADGSAVGVPMLHQGPVDTVAFSSDGTRLVSTSRDKTVRLWDVATCKQIGNPMRHDEAVVRALFNPTDPSRVLSVGWDDAAYLWNADAPQWPGEAIPISGEVRAIEFADTDGRFFVATRAGEAGIWSLPEKRFVTSIIHQSGLISLAAFHPQTKQCATADKDGIIRFWDVASGQKIGETKAVPDTIMALAFAADGHSLFAAYLGGNVLQWKIPEGTQMGPPLKHSEKMDVLAVSPAGDELASGCRDDYLYVWKIGTESAPSRKIRHTNPVLAVTYSPDGRFIATGCDDHTARIWSVASGEQQGEPFYLNGRPTALRFTGGGNALLVSGTQDTDVDCYDTKTHNPLYIPLPHPTGVSHITSNSDGSLVITVTNDGVARLWRIPTTSEPPPKWLPEYIRALGGLAFSPQQQLVQVPTRERLELRKKLLNQPPENTIWDKLMRMSFEQDHPSAPDP